MLTAFLGCSSGCLHGVTCAGTNSLELASEVSTRLVPVFVRQWAKLRKTPFCKKNVAAWPPVGWSTGRSSLCPLRAWAEQVGVIWKTRYQYSLPSFRSVWLPCLLVRSVSAGILKIYTPVCKPEKKKQEICKLNKQESWRNVKLPGLLLYCSNIFSFFVSFFFPNIQLYSFLVIQKDKPERHEKAEKKPPPKGIYLFILHF